MYGGRDLENGTLTVKFKYAVDVAKVKTIDFNALIWNSVGVKRVQIFKLDNTPAEVVKVVNQL